MARAAMTVLLAVMTTLTTRAQNLTSGIDYCGTSVGCIFLSGWAFDPGAKHWQLGKEMTIKVVVSNVPDEQDDNFQGLFNEPEEYLVREDINSQYGLSGIHGFKMRLEGLGPILFEEETEKTLYVNIYACANFGNGDEEILLNKTPYVLNVRRDLAYDAEEEVYYICDADEWDAVATAMEDDRCNGVVGNYFSSCNYRLYESFDNSTPVTKMFGKSTRPFTGTFDGNGQTLNVKLSGTEHVAPFAYTDGVTIQNLTVAGTINATQSAGGIVGYAKNTLTLKNCACGATISGFSQFAGGLLGWCDDLSLTMKNSLFKGAFSPANGGKYHPIVCKDASKTVTMPPVIDLYYVHTAAPSEGIGDNCIPKAKGAPVSTILIDGVWDEPFVAADGITYYGVHFNGKHLPYEYGFDTPLDEEGWTMVDCLESAGIYDSHFSFIWSARAGDDHFQYLISPEFNGHSGITMTFYYLKSPHYRYSATFQVGYSTTTPDIDAFSWDDETTSSIKQWLLYERSFPKGTKYIAVKWHPNHDGTLELDDFSFTVCNAPSPTHLDAVDITEYTASPTWEAPDADKDITGYTYQYKKASEADWSVETTVDATSATLTGLSANTDYQFRVKALYGEEESLYVPISFYTAMELPYDYGFENSMEHWIRGNARLGYESTGISGEAKHEGEKGYHFHWATFTCYKYIISPRFAGTTPLTVSFYYKAPFPSSGIKETFYVGYSTTTSDIDAFHWGEANISSQNPWTRYEQTFPEGTRFIAVKDSTIESNKQGLYIDDFSFVAYSSFPKPTDLIVSDLTDTGATLSWTAPDGDVTGYAYQYRKSTDNTWSAETTVQTTTVTLSNLDENTTYNFRVKALGSGGTASNFVIERFLTDGSVVSLPYTDSFENGMGGWRMRDCHPSTGIRTIEDGGYPYSGEHGFYFHTDSKDEYLYSPHFAGGTPMKVSFYYRNYNSDWPAAFKVGYVSSKSASIIWERTVITLDGEWAQYEASFPAETQCVVICRPKGSAMIYLDDFCFTSMSEIALADHADNSMTINDNKDKNVQVTLQDRTLHRDGMWQTLCLPFSVSIFTGTPLSGATVKTLSSTSFSNGTLTLNFEDANSIEAGKPYLVNWEKAAYLTINSTEDWNAFAESVNNGNTYAGKTVLLGADINVSTMVGTAEHPFSGIFEGATKKLKLNISNGGDGAAPFRYINGATIRDVQTYGSVSGGNYTSGLVGIATGGTNTIHHCWMAATVTGGPHVGGILGNGTTSSTTIHDCKVGGSFSASYIGIVYGWGNAGGTHTIEHCVGAGSYGNYQNIGMMLTDGGASTITGCTDNINIVIIDSEGPLYSEALGDQWFLDENGNIGLHCSYYAYSRENIVNPVFSGFTISDATAPVKTSYVDFIGCTSPVTFNANDPSVLYLDEDNMLHSPSANMTLGSCRAYFKLKGGGYDVNGDSHMDISDVTSLVNIILGKSTPEDKNSADLNGDGNVDISDVTTLVNAILGKISTDTPIKVRVVVSDATGIVYEGQQP